MLYSSIIKMDIYHIADILFVRFLRFQNKVHLLLPVIVTCSCYLLLLPVTTTVTCLFSQDIKIRNKTTHMKKHLYFFTGKDCLDVLQTCRKSRQRILPSFAFSHGKYKLDKLESLGCPGCQLHLQQGRQPMRA